MASARPTLGVMTGWPGATRVPSSASLWRGYLSWIVAPEVAAQSRQRERRVEVEPRLVRDTVQGLVRRDKPVDAHGAALVDAVAGHAVVEKAVPLHEGEPPARLRGEYPLELERFETAAPDRSRPTATLRP